MNPPDKRKFDRVSLRAPAEVTVVDQGAMANRIPGCEVADIGRGGLLILSPHMIHPGRSVIIRVTAGPAKRLYTGVIRHVNYDDGRYALGVEFASLGDEIDPGDGAFGARADAAVPPAPSRPSRRSRAG